MIKSIAGQQLDPLIHRLFPFLFKRRLDPNVLTLCGAGVSLLAAGAFMAGEFLAAGLLVLLSGFFDLTDGVVARHHGIATRFGAFLDSTLDRLVDMTLLIGISVHYAAAGAPEHVLLAGSALIVSVLVSYSKARAELVLPSFDVGFMERGERIALLALGALFGLVVPALWIVTLGGLVTLSQRFALAYREMERLDRTERAGIGGSIQ